MGFGKNRVRPITAGRFTHRIVPVHLHLWVHILTAVCPQWTAVQQAFVTQGLSVLVLQAWRLHKKERVHGSCEGLVSLGNPNQKEQKK
jgi:hypothetical protein